MLSISLDRSLFVKRSYCRHTYKKVGLGEKAFTSNIVEPENNKFSHLSAGHLKAPQISDRNVMPKRKRFITIEKQFEAIERSIEKGEAM